jgi:hypothetical protein
MCNKTLQRLKKKEKKNLVQGTQVGARKKKEQRCGPLSQKTKVRTEEIISKCLKKKKKKGIRTRGP